MSTRQLAQGLRILLFLSAGVWLVVAVAYGLRSGLEGVTAPIMVTLLVMNGLLMAWFGWQVGQTPPRRVGLCLAYLFFNLLGLLLDDFGVADLAYLLFLLVLFIGMFWLYRIMLEHEGTKR